MKKKILESASLIFLLVIWLFFWLNRMYWLELISLCGIVIAGYVFKSSIRWKLILSGFVLLIFIPVVMLMFRGIWYGITVVMAMPLYYLGYLLRCSRKPLNSIVISTLALAPFLALVQSTARGYIAVALYWAVLGFVGGLVHSYSSDMLILPLILYFVSLVMAVNPRHHRSPTFLFSFFTSFNFHLSFRCVDYNGDKKR